MVKFVGKEEQQPLAGQQNPKLTDKTRQDRFWLHNCIFDRELKQMSLFKVSGKEHQNSTTDSKVQMSKVSIRDMATQTDWLKLLISLRSKITKGPKMASSSAFRLITINPWMATYMPPVGRHKQLQRTYAFIELDTLKKLLLLALKNKQQTQQA